MDINSILGANFGARYTGSAANQDNGLFGRGSTELKATVGFGAAALGIGAGVGAGLLLKNAGHTGLARFAVIGLSLGGLLAAGMGAAEAGRRRP